jgi:polyisoprenoid-binding protein YceI
MKYLMMFLILPLCFGINAQKLFTKEGKIYFDATSALEKIDATNNKVNAVIEIASGKIEMAVLVKSFHFTKALMEEHFNENYMESTKFPKATFVGVIKEMGKIDLKKDGSNPINITGKLTMHGVTKDVTTKGTVTIKGGIVSTKCEFKILVEDYKIPIPGVVKDKIAKEATISIDLALKSLK